MDELFIPLEGNTLEVAWGKQDIAKCVPSMTAM